MSYLLEHKQSFPGVEIQSEYLRSYPQGELAAHLLGHLGEISAEQLKKQHFKGYAAGDVVGHGGVEWTYDKWLRGRDGVAKIEVDAFGRPKQNDPVPAAACRSRATRSSRPSTPRSRRRPRRRCGRHQPGAQRQGSAANGGAAVVLDVTNGDVVAMASYPTFDPEVWVGGISTKDYKRLARASRPTTRCSTAADPGAEGGGLHVQGGRRRRRRSRRA